MDSFEWNKIAGAVLFALLVAFGLSIFSGIFFSSEAPEEPGYTIATAEAGGGGGKPAGPEPIAVRLQTADAKAGQNSAKKCLACHTFDQGGPNKVGPNLWGVVDRPIAAHEGYAYSDAMKQHAVDDKTWTFEHLDEFLTDPRKVVDGTKMAFAGLKNPQERANVILFLHTLSDNPVPLPEPQTAAAPAAGGDAAAPAADGAAPAASAPDANAPAANAPAASAPDTSAPAASDTGAAPAATDTPATDTPPASEAPATQGDATQSGSATDAMKPAADAMSGDAMKPATDAMSGDAMKPATDAMSGDAMKPATDAMSGDAMKPATDAMSGDAMKPATDAMSGDAMKPAADAMSGDAMKPAGQ
jgi:cytochrome c